MTSMKGTSFAVLALLALLASPARSESLLGSGIRLGVQGGINFATAKVDPPLNIGGLAAALDQGGITGLAIGALVQINLSDCFTLQAELGIIQKGASYAVNAGGKTLDTIRVKNTYFEIPVLARMNFPLAVVKPYIELGPYLGFLLSSNMSDDLNLTNQDMKSTFKSVDFGGAFGGGVTFTALPLVEIFVDLRYTLGLTNVAQAAGQTIKLNGLQGRVGLTF